MSRPAGPSPWSASVPRPVPWPGFPSAAVPRRIRSWGIFRFYRLLGVHMQILDQLVELLIAQLTERLSEIDWAPARPGHLSHLARLVISGHLQEQFPIPVRLWVLAHGHRHQRVDHISPVPP